MDNIILIGMPAVGKSTVGVIVAKRLGYNFVDTDLVIQEKEGKLLREIIAEAGPDGFLEVEDMRDCPISTGKKSTLSAKLSGSLKEPDIFSVQGSATRKDACGELITSSMSSRLTWIYLHWKIQHWKILRRKNLRWKIQCN